MEVTDETVRVVSGGTGRRPKRSLIESALDWIDDSVGLFDERPVTVADMWRSVVATLLGPRCDGVVVVYPPGWSRMRVDRVVAAVNTVSDHIEAVSADRWVAAAVDKETEETEVPALPGDGRAVRRGHGRAVQWVHGRAMAVLLTTLLMGGFAAWTWPTGSGVRSTVSTVVEGRMSVRIPANWDVQRVHGGPGSRRLQASSPTDSTIALHLTSAYAPETTLADTAHVLGRAMARESPGVFADLRGEVTVAGRPAVTYRESRPGRIITWVVVVVGVTRISIGCQSPPGRESDVRSACEEAVRSARET